MSGEDVGKNLKPYQVLVLVCLSVVLVIGAYPFLCSFIANQHLNQGRKAMDVGAYTKAASSFSTAIDWSPSQPNQYKYLAICYVKQGKFDEALDALDLGVAQNPDRAVHTLPVRLDALIGQAQGVASKGDAFQEALALLTQGEQISKEHLDAGHAHLPRFELYSTLGQLHALKAMLYRQDPALGGPGAEQTAWTKTEEHLTEAVNNVPDELEEQPGRDRTNMADLYSMLASAQRALGRTVAEEKSLAGAVDADPRDILGWSEFHRFANTHERYVILLSTLDTHTKALAQDTPPPTMLLCNLHIMQANVLENGKAKPEQIETAYLDAAKFERDREELWANFARYAMSHDRLEPFRDAIQRLSEPVKGQGMLPQIFLARQAMIADPESVDKASGQLLTRIQNYDDKAVLTVQQSIGWVIPFFVQRLQEEPAGLCDASLNLGILQNHFGAFEQALPYFRRAESCLPDEKKGDLALHWGDALVRTGDVGESRMVLEEAVAEAPDAIALRWSLAQVLGQMNDSDGARAHYEHLLQVPDLNAEQRAVIQTELSRLGS